MPVSRKKIIPGIAELNLKTKSVSKDLQNLPYFNTESNSTVKANLDSAKQRTLSSTPALDNKMSSNLLNKYHSVANLKPPPIDVKNEQILEESLEREQTKKFLEGPVTTSN